MTAKRKWALVLGASSGFGEAAALALARGGRNIFGVHLDRRAMLPNVERITGEIDSAGARAEFFNVNAADAAKRAEVLASMSRTLEEEQNPGAVDVLLHSLAFVSPLLWRGPTVVTIYDLSFLLFPERFNAGNP